MMLKVDYHFLDTALAPDFRAGRLIYRYLHHDLTIEEEWELERWVGANEDNMQRFEDLTDEANVGKFKEWYQYRENERRILIQQGKMRPEDEIPVGPAIGFIAFCLLVGIAWYALHLWLPIPEDTSDFYSRPTLFHLR